MAPSVAAAAPLQWSWWSSGNAAAAAKDEEAAGAAAPAQAMTDEQGHTVGLEDPNDPRLRDDPAIRISSKALLPSRGVPYIDPSQYGGSMLDQSAGLGEPLNVIVSALSSPEVLTRKGLQGYLRSLAFDMECLGLHSGGAQRAFLDPRGWVDENFLYRQVYTPFDYVFGTCVESLRGGNHLRAWQQQGTGAWFFATSKEEDVTKHHMVVPNGYDVGRDALVEQSQSKPNGQTSFMFKKYTTTVEYVSNLLVAGTQGINHDIAIDGRVAVLTVKVLGASDKALLKAQKRESLLSTAKTKRRSLLSRIAGGGGGGAGKTTAVVA